MSETEIKEIIETFDKSFLKTDKKIKKSGFKLKELEKKLRELMEERLQDPKLIRLYHTDLETFTKKIQRGFKVALTRKRLLNYQPGNVYMVAASEPFDYISILQNKQKNKIKKAKKEGQRAYQKFLQETKMINEKGELCDDREFFGAKKDDQGNIIDDNDDDVEDIEDTEDTENTDKKKKSTKRKNPRFGHPWGDRSGYMCNIAGIFHNTEDDTFYWFSSVLGGGEGTDNPDAQVNIKCKKCKQISFNSVCDREVLDEKRQTSICGNVRPKFIYHKLSPAVGMKFISQMSIREKENEEKIKYAQWTSETNFSDFYPIEYVYPNQEYEKKINAELNEAIKDKDEKAIELINKKIEKLKKKIITKEKLVKIIEEKLSKGEIFDAKGKPLDEKSITKACDLENVYADHSPFSWSHGYFTFFKGYVIGFQRETQLGDTYRKIVICDDESFDIDDEPENYRGVRVEIPQGLWELGVKDRIAEESEILVCGNLSKWQDFLPSIRAWGVIVLDGGQPEKIIKDVTIDFESDFAQQDELDGENFDGTIDDIYKDSENTNEEDDESEETDEGNEQEDELDDDEYDDSDDDEYEEPDEDVDENVDDEEDLGEDE